MPLKLIVTSRPAIATAQRLERILGSWLAGSIHSTLWRGAGTLGLIAGLALSANSSANIPASALRPPPDPRAVHLAQFFELYHCPEPHYINEYLWAADIYGLDYRLLPAVSIRETQCGLRETRNNRWGYHPGRQTFPSIEVGIDYVARQLAENPVYKGKSLRHKLFTYNPRPAYPGEVQRIMEQVE